MDEGQNKIWIGADIVSIAKREWHEAGRTDLLFPRKGRLPRKAQAEWRSAAWLTKRRTSLLAL
jgi:hypothetical protein